MGAKGCCRRFSTAAPGMSETTSRRGQGSPSEINPLSKRGGQRIRWADIVNPPPHTPHQDIERAFDLWIFSRDSCRDTELSGMPLLLYAVTYIGDRVADAPLGNTGFHIALGPYQEQNGKKNIKKAMHVRPVRTPLGRQLPVVIGSFVKAQEFGHHLAQHCPPGLLWARPFDEMEHLTAAVGQLTLTKSPYTPLIDPHPGPALPPSRGNDQVQVPHIGVGSHHAIWEEGNLFPASP